MVRRSACIISLIILITGIRAADPAPADLADYRTTATAKTSALRPRQHTTEPAQPGHLGIAVEADGNRLNVTRVEPGSAAESAKIATGDVIASVAGQSVATPEAFRQMLVSKVAGETIEMEIIRDGKSLKLSFRLFAPSKPMHDGNNVRPALGVQLKETRGGVEVEGFSPGSLAEQFGIQVGDVIVKINGSAVERLDALRSKISEHKPGDTVDVQLVRGDKPMNVSVALTAQGQVEDMPSLARWDTSRMQIFRRPVYRLAVVPIQFSDVKLNEKITPADWETALFSTGAYKQKNATGQNVYGSLNDYYQELSCGKFHVEGKVLPAVTVNKNRQEYTQTQTKTALLVEAGDKLIERDGEKTLAGFDGIFFIYAGGRYQTQRTSIYWPHRSSFSFHGKRWPYFICPEGGERMNSISVLCHEFGHMLGLPDLYAKPDAPGDAGLGVWCTMSTGHGRDGKPLHFSAWCKEQLGWIKPAVIDPRDQQKLLLAPINGTPTECFKILMRADGSEYLLLENRIKKGFDRDLPGEGLLIWRVVDGRPILEESHGIGGPDGPRRFLGSVPYPSASNRSFTPDTTPSSKPSKPGGWNVHLTDIRRLEDGRITFQIGYEYF